jgi:hypothetical protein
MDLPSHISAGLLDMLFADGDLRKVRLSGKEIVQRFYFAVRDKEWLNVPCTLNNFKKERGGYSYILSFAEGSIHFEVDITIRFDDGAMTLKARGKSLSSFLKNRIGFCINLPSELKNSPCKVLHTGGDSTLSVFPELISPHQPFKDIRSIEWSSGSYKIRLSFEGDVFEMEDQRNWTDASYKIYSTPLSLPFPVAVGKGDDFYQKITMSFSHRDSPAAYSADTSIERTDSEILAVPELGIYCPEDIPIISTIQREARRPFVSFLRIDFRFDDPNWQEAVSHNTRQAVAANMRIGAVLYFGDDVECETDDFVKWARSLPDGVTFSSITLLTRNAFVLADKELRYITAILHHIFPGVPIGSGTDANFAQLNRNRPDTSCLDFVSFGIQPAEHSCDALSFVENIGGQADAVLSAKHFAGGKDIQINSLSLFRRFNANNRFTSENSAIPNYPLSGTDFEAGWFVGSLQQLISAGATSIVCTTLLGKNPALVCIFRHLASNPPECFYDCGSPDPERYSLLSWMSAGKKISVFANHTNTEISLTYQSTEVRIDPLDLFFYE